MRTVERGITREALRACPARLACMPRLAACMLLSVLLALVPLEAQISNWDGFGGLSKRVGGLSLQKSEAHANPAAVAGAGAALSALALELGISESALMAGIAVSAAGATGLAVNMALDPSAPPAPGFKPWDDLTPEEKGIWGDYNPGTGTGGDIETYQKNAIGWWALQYGMLETGDNGGYQPSSEPDPEQDPEGHSKWVKARNVMIALGAGGAAVAFNDAVSPLIDNASANLRSMLFGTGDNELSVPYSRTYTVADKDIDIRYVTKTSSKTSNPCMNVTYDGNRLYYFFPKTIPNPLKFSDYGTYYQTGTVACWDVIYGSNGELIGEGQYNRIFTSRESGGYTYFTTAYNYSFGGTALYLDGEMTGDYVDKGLSYGQMVDTPDELGKVLIQPNETINNYYNDYTNNDGGDKRGLAIPTNFSEPGYSPEYPDLIKTITPDNDIPIPDDIVYPGTGWNPDNMPSGGNNPDPNPNPNPNPDWPTPNPDFDYPDSIGEAIDNLGNAVFDQLFPFCLIGDIRRLCEKFNPSPQNVRMLGVASDSPDDASQYSIVLPLSDFGVDGVDDLTFEMGPVFSVALMVRPWWTVLFAAGLIAESVRYFLK